MFRIGFDGDERTKVGGLAVGTIVIGSFRERFESPLHFWQQPNYEGQWHQAIRRLVDGAESTALITDLHDPALANFIRWWPKYQIGAEARIHNQLLFMEHLREPFDLGDVYAHVPHYEQTTEDGDRLSEWSVPLADLERFVDGRSAEES